MRAFQFKSLALSVLCLGALAGCKEGSLISGAELKAEVQQGQVYVDVITKFDTQRVRLMNTQIPIYNPNNPLELLGQLTISNSSAETTDLSLKLNLSYVAKLPSLTPELALPNGTPFPVQGVSPTGWYSIPLGNSQVSKLYININSTAKTALVGYALSSDSLSLGVMANLLMPFSSSNVSGVGGIYSGPQAGQSGVLLFANVSSVFQSTQTTVQTKLASFSQKVVQPVKYVDGTSQKKKDLMWKKLYKMNLIKSKVRWK